MKPSTRAVTRLLTALAGSTVYELPFGFVVVAANSTFSPGLKRRRRTKAQMTEEATARPRKQLVTA